MIGALLCRGNCAERTGSAPGPPAQVVRAGSEFMAWASADVPHASLASLPGPDVMDGPAIVCGVLGTLFDTEQLERELTPSLADEPRPLSAASLLARGYQAIGRDFIAAVDGEFATFLYDAARGRLITRTDGIGIGRLYYAHTAAHHGVCTDLSALLALSRPAGVRTQALREYFFLGYIPAPHSAYDDVYKSLPGHSQVLNTRDWVLTDTGQHAAPASRQGASPLTGAKTSDAEDMVLAAIERSIEKRLDGATSATVLLTSGYDSTLCAAILKSKCAHVRSFTIGFNERAVNENEDARKIATHLGLEHQDLMFPAERLLDTLVEWVHAHAEPWCHPNGLPTYVAHGELRKRSGDRMVFDGSGGDYLFRDFSDLAAVIAQHGAVPTGLAPRLIHAFPRQLKQVLFRVEEHLPSWRLRNAVQRAARADLNPADRLIFHNPWNSAGYRQLLGGDFPFAETRPGREYFAGGTAPLDRYLAYYRSWGFDASVGRAVMESRLQGMRATFPYEDAALVRLLEHVPRQPNPGGGGMRYLQESITRRFIPAEYFASRKKAMETPLELLLGSERGRALVDHYFARARQRQVSLYDRDVAESFRQRFYAGEARHALKVWSVLCFEIWREGVGHRA